MPVEVPEEASYPAARAMARHLAPVFTPAPSEAVMERLIVASFWASLRREEGVSPTISLGWLPPEEAPGAIRFARPIALTPESLTKLAPAVERPGIHLGIWKERSALHIWGASQTLPPGCLVVEVVAPGLLVIKQPGAEESAKYRNVAVLEGDQVKLLGRPGAVPGGVPPVVETLLRRGASPSLLVELAVSMRKHRRGGSLLVVPDGALGWHESIVEPMAYQVLPPEEGGTQRPAIDTVAGLTAVDGATIITVSGELLAFGAKITRREGHPRVDQVAVSELIEGDMPRTVHPAQLGGTRHLSAAQFAQDQRDSVALVASQDGRFTVFAWSLELEMVHAYRVETYLV